MPSLTLPWWILQAQGSDVVIGWALLIGAAAFAGIAIILLFAKGKSR